MSDISSIEPQRSIAEGVAESLSNIVDVSAQRVYSEPVQVGERIVIPAATVESAGGFGFGADNLNNGGGGGGGWGNGRPVAIVEAGPEGVRIKPVLDFTKLALTLVAAGLTIWRATRK